MAHAIATVERAQRFTAPRLLHPRVSQADLMSEAAPGGGDRPFTLRQVEERVLTTDATWLEALLARPALVAASSGDGAHGASTGAPDSESDASGVAVETVRMAHKITAGDYPAVLQSEAAVFLFGAPREGDPLNLADDCTMDNAVTLMRHRAAAWLEHGGFAEPAPFCSDHVAVLRASTALWAAVASLNLYLQVPHRAQHV